MYLGLQRAMLIAIVYIGFDALDTACIAPSTDPPGKSSRFKYPNAQLGAHINKFGWFVGHVTLLMCALRYGISYITFHTYTGTAKFSYRTAFVAAAATYGIVVYKAYRARMRTGNRQQGGPLALAGDENVQYLGVFSILTARFNTGYTADKD